MVAAIVGVRTAASSRPEACRSRDPGGAGLLTLPAPLVCAPPRSAANDLGDVHGTSTSINEPHRPIRPARPPRPDGGSTWRSCGGASPSPSHHPRPHSEFAATCLALVLAWMLLDAALPPESGRVGIGNAAVGPSPTRASLVHGRGPSCLRRLSGTRRSSRSAVLLLLVCLIGIIGRCNDFKSMRGRSLSRCVRLAPSARSRARPVRAALAVASSWAGARRRVSSSSPAVEGMLVARQAMWDGRSSRIPRVLSQEDILMRTILSEGPRPPGKQNATGTLRLYVWGMNVVLRRSLSGTRWRDAEPVAACRSALACGLVRRDAPRERCVVVPGSRSSASASSRRPSCP